MPSSSDDRRPDPGDGGQEDGGVPIDRVLQIGIGTDNDASQFDMTALSLRLTRGANAVSKLHAVTANNTWRGVPKRDILAITNGIHTPTWVGGPIRELYERYLDADLDDLDNATEAGRWWERLDHPSPAELWAAISARSASSRSSRAAGCEPSSRATASRARSSSSRTR